MTVLAPRLRVHIGDEGRNRFGAKIVNFLEPLLVVTPDVLVIEEWRFKDTRAINVAPVAANVCAASKAFFEAVAFLDDQLVAAADVLGADPWDYRPLLRHTPDGVTMKIKVPPNVATDEFKPGQVRSLCIRVDHVWFMGEAWGATWRIA